MSQQLRHLQISVPGKTFLLGEYLALAGGPTFIVTTKPNFISTIQAGKSSEAPWHPESPAGQLWSQEKLQNNFQLDFNDPYLKQGGFGGSTAEFLSTYLLNRLREQPGLTRDELLSEPHFTRTLWQDFRSLFEGRVTPSGADLVAQYCGAVTQFNTKTIDLEVHPWLFPDHDVLLLKTPYKIKSHEHIGKLNIQNLPLEDLWGWAEEGARAFNRSNWPQFVESVAKYSGLLRGQGLLCEASQNSVDELNRRPDVQLARGCGALGADVIAVFIEAEKKSALREELRDFPFVISVRDDLSSGTLLKHITSDA